MNTGYTGYSSQRSTQGYELQYHVSRKQQYLQG